MRCSFYHGIFAAAGALLAGCSADRPAPAGLSDGKVGAATPDSAAPDALPRDAMVVDAVSRASPDGAAQEIACGPQPCWVDREECCLALTGAICVPIEKGCEGVGLQCDGPEDCGGHICCAEVVFEIDAAMATAGIDSVGLECRESCNFAFDPDLAARRLEITARACHGGADCVSTEPVCCAIPGVDAGMCLTQSAAALAEEYTYGVMDCG
ncbi:hypothetical protein HYW17_05355 [Candidatus Uhrbacteria bacterium]|nr:hypothetical protein [Candidatus Uhrbacteria bacterium]